MGHRFDDTVIEGECRPDEILAVSRYGRPEDAGDHTGLQAGLPEGIEPLPDGADRIPAVRRVPGQRHTAIVVHQKDLRCRGTGIDPEETGFPIEKADINPLRSMLPVTIFPGGELLMIPKKGREPFSGLLTPMQRSVCEDLHAFFQFEPAGGIPVMECRPRRREQLRVIADHNPLLRIEMEQPVKGLAQTGKEG